MRAFEIVFAVVVIAIVLWALAAVVAGWLEARAVRAARWEPYAEEIGDGYDEVGIQLVARWGRGHQRVLYRNDQPTRVASGDTQALSDAQFAAATLANANNSFRVSARNWPTLLEEE